MAETPWSAGSAGPIDAEADPAPLASSAEAAPQSESEPLEAAMSRLTATVDLLLDPPGCEWNRAQTHRSLVTYLVEETFELVEAIEDGTPADLREELGDVLYQVVLHAAIAARSEGFGLAEVVREVDEKIRRRHPHVFGAESASDVEDIVRLWSAAKAVEKRGRTSAFDGVPVGLPALARAQKLAGRRAAGGAEHAAESTAATGAEPGAEAVAATGGEPVLATEAGAGDASGELGGLDADEIDWGRRMLVQVDLATQRGFDAERAVRAAVREREAAWRSAEAAVAPAPGGGTPGEGTPREWPPGEWQGTPQPE